MNGLLKAILRRDARKRGLKVIAQQRARSHGNVGRILEENSSLFGTASGRNAGG